jgi:transposase
MYPYYYYKLYLEGCPMFNLRLEMVKYAKKYGNKPAPVFYNTTVKTVKLWKKRFEENGKDGLKKLSSKPHNSPNELNN